MRSAPELKILGCDKEPVAANAFGTLTARYVDPETGLRRTVSAELAPGVVSAKTFLIQRGTAWRRLEIWCLIRGGKAA